MALISGERWAISWRVPRRVAAVTAVLAIAVVGLLVPSIAVPAAVPAAAAATGVTGDDGSDVYIGTGGLLVPQGALPGSQRRDAAGCRGCEWRMTSPCVTKGDRFPPSPDTPGCAPIPAWCFSGRDRLWLWRRIPADGRGWVRYGSMCRPDHTPTTTDQVDDHVLDSFLRRLPEPSPGRQPAGQAVVNIPVVFAAGGRTSAVRHAETLAGVRVEMRARPTWTWRFGDGSGLQTGRPGGSWPNRDVAHTYRSPGRYTARVSVAWPATYTVDGLGPFAVTETVTTQAAATIRVREARAVLIARN